MISNNPRLQIAPIIKKPTLSSHFDPLRMSRRIAEIRNNKNTINAKGPMENAPSIIRGKNAPVQNQNARSHFDVSILMLRNVTKKPITPISAQSRSTKPGRGQTGEPVIRASVKRENNAPPTDTIAPKKDMVKAVKSVQRLCSLLFSFT
jgi:hypothetical protein